MNQNDVEVAGPDDLGLDEAALEVAVDHPGGLWRERALVYRACEALGGRTVRHHVVEEGGTLTTCQQT